jgi:hypothetical protein
MVGSPSPDIRTRYPAGILSTSWKNEPCSPSALSGLISLAATIAVFTWGEPPRQARMWELEAHTVPCRVGRV